MHTITPEDGARDTAESDLLRAAAALCGVTLDGSAIARLLRYRELLLDWNTRQNLTAITAPRDVLARHFIDSLTYGIGCDWLTAGTPARVLDVGSGGGFPGLVIAIVRPAWQVTSLEATAKKVRFQSAAIDELGLGNALAIQGRAEVLAHEQSWRGRFDLVTARALAALSTLLEWCQPFAKVEGGVIAWKKGDIAQELLQGAAAASILQGSPPEKIALPADLVALVPELGDERYLIRVRQLLPAPARYPRAGATSMKSPLGQR